MLNRYNSFQSVAFIFFLLFSVLKCQATIINDILICEQDKKVYNIPATSTKTYAITLEIITTSALPLMMAIFNQGQNISIFDADSLSANSNIDVDSIQMNRKIQKMYFTPSMGQTELIIGIFRAKLGSLSYSSNIDRNIQSFDGGNTEQITKCTTIIAFKITILSQNSVLKINPPQPVPQQSSDCLFGTFNTYDRSCQCHQNYGMALCDAYFYKLTDLEKTIRKLQLAGGKSFYIFEPSEKTFDGKLFLTVQINLKGNLTSKFTYNDQYAHPQFKVLLIAQETSERIGIASYFNQINPSLMTGVVLKQGQRLIFTVYKPRWATSEVYEVSVSLQDSLLSQIIIIVIAVCSSITILFVIVFILYLFYTKRRRHHELLASMGAAVPVRNQGMGGNKVINFYFSCDQYFPTVKYSELEEAKLINEIQEGEGGINRGCCAICLDFFEKDSQVKSTYCLHIFHRKCLSQWMLRQPLCPLCRKQYSPAIIDKADKDIGIQRMRLSPIDKYIKIWKKLKSQKQNVNTLPPLQIESSQNLNPCNSEARP